MNEREAKIAISRCTPEEKQMLLRLPHDERVRILELKLHFPGSGFVEEQPQQPPVRDVPHARASDPATSKKAAAEIEEDEGTTSTIRPKSLKHLALQELALAPATSNELVRRTGKDGIWKRVSDLKNAGLIDVVGRTVDAETRKENDVMAANEYGHEALLVLSGGMTWNSP
ncbi:MAG TPA: hypothetical protein VLA89_04365 [Gemmatimonadales bacterium]|nr:hypothetical protein [Gemmatimonadales bacterium]